MCPDDVRAAVEVIRSVEDDIEDVHVQEDTLRERVLKAIAEGDCDQPQECARIALTTSEIGDTRWYA
jgi:hypothetical protein